MPKSINSDQFVTVEISALKENPRNARRHSPRQIEHLKAIIARVGFVQPVLIDAANTLVAGHGRLEAARQLGFKQLPAIRLEHLSPTELRALAIADNRIAELSTWDDAVLKIELAELVLDQPEVSISDLTGFSSPEIDALVFADDFANKNDPADDVAPTPCAQPISEVGDIWRADGLTLACGDALSGESYHAALGGTQAGLVLTDPPFNVRIAGHVSGKGKARHREFVQASGEMTEAEFTDFLTRACRQMKHHAVPGSLFYIFMDGAHLFELLSAARSAGLAQKAFVTWAKTNAGMGSLYRSQTEQVVVLKSSSKGHVNNVQLGRFGRNRTTLWTYPGANAFGRNRNAALAQHPTVKPVALLADAILDASHRGDIVLDPFAGSGSTLIAAHRTKRQAVGIELDPLHVDAALARIEAVTGLGFTRQSDGKTFAALSGGAPHE